MLQREYMKRMLEKVEKRQKIKNSLCNFPGCRNTATTTYLGMPLCEKHYRLALFIVKVIQKYLA